MAFLFLVTTNLCLILPASVAIMAPATGAQIIMSRFTSLFLLVCMASPAFGDAAKCRLIKDDAERLQCYDSAGVEGLTPSDQFANLSISGQWDVLQSRKLYKMTPYEPIYLLPIAYTSSPNETPFPDLNEGEFTNTEVKFQVSTRLKISNNLLHRNVDLWFGYTQKTFWQLYNKHLSAMFRETDYKPEVFFSLATDFKILNLDNRFIDFGITHESNGREDPLSRSWNRLFTRFGLVKDELAVVVTPWWRIPETDSRDDNPHIEDYVGRGEVRIVWKTANYAFSTALRNNLDSSDNRGSVEISWVFPISGSLNGVFQYFSGYGESLVDYNQRMQRYSLGIVLIDWI